MSTWFDSCWGEREIAEKGNWEKHKGKWRRRREPLVWLCVFVLSLPGFNLTCGCVDLHLGGNRNLGYTYCGMSEVECWGQVGRNLTSEVEGGKEKLVCWVGCWTSGR